MWLQGEDVSRNERLVCAIDGRFRPLNPDPLLNQPEQTGDAGSIPAALTDLPVLQTVCMGSCRLAGARSRRSS
jgi:hypothetical protein